LNLKTLFDEHQGGSPTVVLYLLYLKFKDALKDQVEKLRDHIQDHLNEVQDTISFISDLI
jgi:uncharacterized protein YdhG (YjbR/CyaY superfamily)